MLLSTMRRWLSWWAEESPASDSDLTSPTSIANSGCNAPSIKQSVPSGIKLLYDTGDSAIDIIFVHGLTGHREKTWRAQDAVAPWPQTLLPTKVPNARVLTFGYDSHVADWRGLVSKNRIGNHSMNLLTAVATYRENDDTNNRPIIFVAHSLGGLVCEDALVASRQSPDKHLQNILQLTRGIIFLGTPHHGADLARWAEKLARWIGLIKETNTEIVQVLKADSEVLARIQGSFHTMIRARNKEGLPPIEITCFFEELPLPGVGLAVPLESAILPGYTSIGIRSNHMDMTKFEGEGDSGFIAVTGELRRWSKQSCFRALSPEESEYLQQLYTVDYDFHRRKNSTWVAGTCEWFLKHQKYQQWRQTLLSTILWLSANPGCGKSVCASFIIEELRTLHNQTGVIGTTCFFFFSDDDVDHRDATACLRALLHQLLSAKPWLIEHSKKDFLEKGQKCIDEFHTLWKIFTMATGDPRCGNVVCVIDALDECEESSRNELIDALVAFCAERERHNPNGASLKFIVTSRPYASIETRFHMLPQIRLKAEEESSAISSDVRLFVKARVKTIGLMKSLPETTQEDLVKRLINNADRTFLWVSLVLKMIENSAKATKKALDAILDTLPCTLDAVYEKILGQTSDREDARRMLHIMAAAVRPLSLKEMNVAFTIQSVDNSTEDLDLEPSISSTVKNICGLFVTVTDSKLYFIHQTAREFLFKPSKGAHSDLGVWKHSLDPVESHAVIARACVTYLSFREFELHPLVISHKPDGQKQHIKSYLESHDFLEYAAKAWGIHVRRCEIKEQQVLLAPILGLYKTKSARFWTWFQIFWTSISNLPTPPADVTMLMLASYFGHTSVIKQLLAQGVDISAKDTQGWTALHWAAWEGHGTVWEGHEAVQLLLDAGINPAEQDEEGLTALHWSAEDGQAAIIRILLDARVDYTVRDKAGLMAHHRASLRGGEKAMEAFLDRGVDIEATDSQGRKALFWAIQGEHEGMTQLLIARGADLYARGNEDGWTALHLATSYGQKGILSLLLNNGVDLEVKNDHGWTALHHAVFFKHAELVQLLLDKGGNSEAVTATGSTPLHMAATNGLKEPAECLLAKGANLEARNDDGLTALHLVAIGGHAEVALLLLEKGADLEVASVSGHTPLHYAASNGHKEVALRLLNKGADLKVKDNQGWTALHHAAYHGHEGVVRLLIEKGADMEAVTNTGHTPLQTAAGNGRKEVVHFLLDNGTELEANDEDQWTALHQAAYQGHIDVVQLLLEKGADLKALTQTGQTPQEMAAEKGHEEVSWLLFEKARS